MDGFHQNAPIATQFPMHLCYLDFDGVLHDEDVWFKPGKGIYVKTPGRRLFEWEPILVDLLAPHPQVKLILSTTWVRVKRFSYAKSRLCPALQSRVIGATFHQRLMVASEFASMPRGLQILGDVLRRQPIDWFAIDDDGFGWPAWCRDKLVLTQGRHGLNDPAVQEDIRRRLTGMFKTYHDSNIREGSA
jgi:hypothetical protein